MVTSSVLAQLLAQRHSCRHFASTPVAAADIDTLVRVGLPHSKSGWGYPSAHDRRPVRIELVGDHVDRFALEDASFDDQPWIRSAPVILVLTAILGPVMEEFADQDATGLRGRDFVMIEAGLLAQSVLLTCTALGLGSVLVAGVHQQAMQRALDVDRHVIALIAAGYPDQQHR